MFEFLSNFFHVINIVTPLAVLILHYSNLSVVGLWGSLTIAILFQVVIAILWSNQLFGVLLLVIYVGAILVLLLVIVTVLRLSVTRSLSEVNWYFFALVVGFFVAWFVLEREVAIHFDYMTYLSTKTPTLYGFNAFFPPSAITRELHLTNEALVYDYLNVLRSAFLMLLGMLCVITVLVVRQIKRNEDDRKDR